MQTPAPERKLGIGAYLALIFAIIFFSGLAKNESFVKMLPDKQWVAAASVFDFGTLNGSFGKVLTSAVSLDEVRQTLQSYSYSVCYAVTAEPGTQGKGGSEDVE